MLQAGCIGIMVTLAMCFFGFILENSYETVSQALIVSALFLYMMLFGLTLGPLVWLYIPEIVTAKVVPFSIMSNWIGSSLCVVLFPIIITVLPNENPAFIFLFFLLYTLVAFFTNFKIIIETKDRRRE